MARYEIAALTRVSICINQNTCKNGAERTRVEDITGEEACFLCGDTFGEKPCEYRKDIYGCVSFEPPERLKPTCPTCGVEVHEVKPGGNI